MESRTSPAQTGSVRPLSECRVAFSPPFRAWVSRRVGPVVICAVSSALGEVVEP